MKGFRWPVAPPRVAHALRRAGVQTVIAMLIAILDPFGSVTWTEMQVHEFWQRLYAPYYEPGPASRKRDARDDVTVVLIDDQARNALARNRPLDAMDMAQVIDDIIQAPGPGAAPQAVFVDIFLGAAAPSGTSAAKLLTWNTTDERICAASDRRKVKSAFRCLLIEVARITAFDRWKTDTTCQKNALEKLLCIERSGGIPVLIADPHAAFSRDGAQGPDAAGLEALNWVAATAPVRMMDRHYPMDSTAPPIGGGAAPRLALSPAAALYAAYCQRNASACTPEPVIPPEPGARKDAGWSAQFHRSVDVIWGVDTVRPPDPWSFASLRERLEGAAPRGCEVARRGLWPVLWQGLKLTLSGVFHSPAQACPYTNMLPYWLLQGLSLPDQRKAFGGKIVMLGAQLSDQNDLVPAAPYGALPGVYLHAMVLDNLIQRGAAYPKSAEPMFRGLEVSRTEFGRVIVLFAITFALALATAPFAITMNAAGRRIPAKAQLLRVALLIASLMVVLLLSFTLTGGLTEDFNTAFIALAFVVGVRDFAVEASRKAWDSLSDKAVKGGRPVAARGGLAGGKNDGGRVDGPGAGGGDAAAVGAAEVGAGKGVSEGSDRPL